MYSMSQCRQNDDCLSTGNCSEGKCQSSTKQGDFCKENKCPRGLVCHEKLERCVKPCFNWHAPCRNNNECPEGTYCNGGHCAPSPNEGGSCAYEKGCGIGLECHKSVCVARCRNDDDCGRDFYCRNVGFKGFKGCIKKTEKDEEDEKKEIGRREQEKKKDKRVEERKQTIHPPARKPEHDRNNAEAKIFGYPAFSVIMWCVFFLVIIALITLFYMYMKKRKRNPRNNATLPPPPIPPQYMIPFYPGGPSDTPPAYHEAVNEIESLSMQPQQQQTDNIKSKF